MGIKPNLKSVRVPDILQTREEVDFLTRIVALSRSAKRLIPDSEGKFLRMPA